MSSKPLKTAGALRAGDTEFMHSDMRRKRQTVPVEVLIQAMDHPDSLAALGWSVEDARAAVDAARKPKLSATLALRASSRIEFICFEHSGNYQGIGQKEAAAIISNEFAFVDELVECFREYTEDGECYCLSRSEGGSSEPCGHCKARALLERIEKGTK